jgi:hypothetical protein
VRGRDVVGTHLRFLLLKRKVRKEIREAENIRMLVLREIKKLKLYLDTDFTFLGRTE